MQNVYFYQNYLNEELSSRCERNPRYSIRAFSKALRLDPGTLSRILSGKYVPSVKMSKKIGSHLGFSPEVEQQFLTSIASAQYSRRLQRVNLDLKKLQSAPQPIQEMKNSLFRVIAEWYHAAILELTFVPNFKNDPHWIASEIGISVTEAKLAIARLMDLGMLRPNGARLVKSQNRLMTADRDKTTLAHKKFQKQILEKAIYSLENDPIEHRNMTSMTMAIDPKNLSKARILIDEFTISICDLLESGKPSTVYNLGISLYPIQKIRNSFKEN